jgi:hypothetical protein
MKEDSMGKANEDRNDEEVTLQAVSDEIRRQGATIKAELRRSEGNQRKITMASMLGAAFVAFFVGGAVIGTDSSWGLGLVIGSFVLAASAFVVVSKIDLGPEA